jgi:hypothetical protein
MAFDIALDNTWRIRDDLACFLPISA